MRGKKAKQLRFSAGFMAHAHMAHSDQAKAPEVMGDWPVKYLLKDTATGTLMVPANAGRFYYRRSKGWAQGRSPFGQLSDKASALLALLNRSKTPEV